MSNIMILEDEQIQALLLKDLIESAFSDVSITICTSIGQARDIIDQSTIPFNIFLLDIKLPDGSGMDFAAWLRSSIEYGQTPIVFITGYDSYALPAINKAHCFSYILKPYTSEEIVMTIKKLLDMQSADVDKKAFITISTKGFNYKVELDDILYIEIIQKSINVHTRSKTIRIPRYSLKKIMQQLPSRTFVQCHRSFLVNKDILQTYESRNKNTYIDLVNGERLPVGIKYKDNISSLIGDVSNR